MQRDSIKTYEGDHAGRLRGFATSGGPTQRGWNSTAPATDSLLPILERRRRARSVARSTAPIRPMLRFKQIRAGGVTIRGIELAEKVKKNQFNLRPLTKKRSDPFQHYRRRSWRHRTQKIVFCQNEHPLVGNTTRTLTSYHMDPALRKEEPCGLPW